MAIKIDRYYDITCSECGHSRSTDFACGLAANISSIRKKAAAEGWKSISANGEEKTLCPCCAAKCKYNNCGIKRHEGLNAKDSCTQCDNYATATGFCSIKIAKAIKKNPVVPSFVLYPRTW